MMRTYFRAAWRDIFSMALIIPSIAAVLCLAVAGNAVYAIFTVDTAHDRWYQTGLAIGGLILLGVLVLAIGWITKLRLPHERFYFTHTPRPRRGLIYMMSQEEPLRKAIAYHKSELLQCWLLCSAQTFALAKNAQAELQQQGITVPDPLVVNDVYDPLEVCGIVDKIYQNLPAGWRPDDVIADFLGMTATCSAGMVLACLDRDRPLQFTRTLYDDDRKPLGPGNPQEIAIDWQRIQRKLGKGNQSYT